MMRIVNVNYAGRVVNKNDLQHLQFRRKPPCMCVLKGKNCKTIVFRSGKCRVMGNNVNLEKDELPIPIVIERMQSATATIDLGRAIVLTNLYKALQNRGVQVQFEPELFPALRVTQYRPLCVNVFGSGKCVITGVKDLSVLENVRSLLVSNI